MIQKNSSVLSTESATNALNQFVVWLKNQKLVEEGSYTCLQCERGSDQKIPRILARLNLPLHELKYVAQFRFEHFDKEENPVYEIWYAGCSRGKECPSIYTAEALLAELEHILGVKAELTLAIREKVDRNLKGVKEEIVRVAAQRARKEELTKKWEGLKAEVTKIAHGLGSQLTTISAELTSSKHYDPELWAKVQELWPSLTKLP